MGKWPSLMPSENVDIYGVTPEEAMEQVDDVFAAIHPADVEYVERVYCSQHKI